jgi:hypothetical protein
MFISNKADCKPKLVRRDKEGPPIYTFNEEVQLPFLCYSWGDRTQETWIYLMEDPEIHCLHPL